MYQVFVEKEAGANSSSAMERRDHFKNPESPKSLTSRGNFSKKTLLSVVYIVFLSCTCFAQDIINTRDSRKINAKVIEVNVDNVRYRNFDNQDGPIYTILKSEITSIIYQNGHIDTFETAETSIQIGTLNAKELEKIFMEAIEKVSPFERFYAEFVFIEGVKEFFNVWIHSTECKKAVSGEINKEWRRSRIAEQKCIELTGMSFSELHIETVKYLGEASKLMYGIYPIGRMENKNNLMKFLNNYRKPEELISLIDESLLEVEASSAMIIPEDYRYSFAIKSMLGYVKNGRAKDWKECVSVYELDLHQKRMEQKDKPSPHIFIEKESQTFRIFGAVLDFLWWGIESGANNWSRDAFQ